MTAYAWAGQIYKRRVLIHAN
uniref:Uncharacterized protein n=1 Tax=Arundo donax TaxID=35708 RepID=A0A0A9BMF3_ARUDO